MGRVGQRSEGDGAAQQDISARFPQIPIVRHRFRAPRAHCRGLSIGIYSRGSTRGARGARGAELLAARERPGVRVQNVGPCFEILRPLAYKTRRALHTRFKHLIRCIILIP